MASNAITEKPDDSQRPGIVASELAPSLLREDEPAFPRTLGMIGATLTIVGGMALLFNLAGWTVALRTGWSIFVLAVGLGGLLFHAAFDRDIQVRRLYLIFAVALLALGLILSVLPYPERVGDQFRYGVTCLLLALLFLTAFLRTEDVEVVRDITQRGLLVVGGILALVGLFGGSIRQEFLLPIGLVCSLVGLCYLVAFVNSRGIGNDLAYYVALGLAAAGLLVCLVSLGRSLIGTAGQTYFVSAGVVLFFVGATYLFSGLLLALDWPLMVLTRRELGTFFYSPIAYLTLFGFVILSFVAYFLFVNQLVRAELRQGEALTEPIVQSYFFALFPVFTAVIVVPVLTMRLLSEEQRSGTLEVLLTAPVDESVVVLSKFIAALITYMLMWAPFGLFLLAIPLLGGNPFDYRPMLSFFLVMLITGAAFLSAGLFFSSLTSSQIASGVLTGAWMMLLTFFYFLHRLIERDSPNWAQVFRHMSYLDLWYSSLDGVIVPKYLLFFICATIFFLFLTVKVLESRKWR